MALTPIAFILLEKFGEPIFAKQELAEYDVIPDDEHPVFISGFGRMGQIIGRVLSMHTIEFTAIESSANQVDFSSLATKCIMATPPTRKFCEPYDRQSQTVYFGD